MRRYTTQSPRLKLKYLRFLFEPFFNPPLWKLPFLLGAYLIAPDIPMRVGTRCPYFIFQVLILIYTLEFEKKSLKGTYIYSVFNAQQTFPTVGYQISRPDIKFFVPVHAYAHPHITILL